MIRKQRLLLILLVIIMLTTVLAGCRRSSNDEVSFGMPDYVFVPEITAISIPQNRWVENFVIANDTVFFSTGHSGVAGESLHTESLMSINVDGSGLTELPDYKAKIPARIMGGQIRIAALHIDSGGFLWIIESGRFFIFNPQLEEMTTTMIHTLRKLDDTGAELFSLDISEAIADNFFSPVTFCIDDEGNIYVNTRGNIHVHDSFGRLLFILELQGRDTSVIRLPDGSAAGFGWRGQNPMLMHIDADNKSWGETITLPPMNIRSVFPGNDEFTVMFNDNVSLYGICAETGEAQLLINWVDSGLNVSVIGDIAFLSGGQHLLAVRQMNEGIGEIITELIFLTKTPYGELPERTMLTLGTYKFEGDIRSAVLFFNRTSRTHRIHVIDYSIYNTHDNHLAGLTRLYTEIIAGRIPDILDMSNLPFELYAARGLLEDLNPFLDADIELSRSGLMDNVLRATEIDGALYKVFPTFSVSTIIGNPLIVGSDPGWTLSEFKDVLAANPQADIPLGPTLSRESLLELLFRHNIEQFVDWESGAATFENSLFIDILELSSIFPPEQDTFAPASHIELYEIMTSKRQIMYTHDIGSFHHYALSRTMLGGEAAIKGFPVENRDGSRFNVSGGVAITAGCSDKQGAWEFVRLFLTESFLRELIYFSDFSVNKTILEEGLIYAMDPVNKHGIILSLEPYSGFLADELSQEEADRLIALIESTTKTLEHDEILWNIISESASDYFNGRITVQDAVRIIQSRASRYMAEMG